MPLELGTSFGHYQIHALLGTGGMGEVYRARDTTLKRDVALKVLPAAFLRDPERMARFQREAEVLASLDHPNVGPIYGIVESEGARALVLALVEGPTLADRIAAGPLPQDEALAIARQMVEALEYAHDRGVVHRDLKPANVKINPDGVVKVLDFGLAKVLEDEPPASALANSPTLTLGHTRAGVILGTAAYMSPEQAVGRPVDRRSDIFSFGAVLYEMLCGRRAFAGGNTPDVLEAVVKSDPDWGRLPAGTAPTIERLLRRCLTKDRKQRLQAIGEARIVLDNPGGADVPQVKAGPTRTTLPWVAASVATLAAAAFAVVHLREKAPAAPDTVRFDITLPANVTLAPPRPFAVSPDGRKVAFAAASGGVTRMWLRTLDSVEVRPLAGTETDPATPPPFWSPDSRFIAFSAGGKLKKVDVSGGPAQTICDFPGVLPGGSWNRDGVIVFGGTALGILKVPAAGGTPIQVTKPDAARQEISHTYPVFLSDGLHFLYNRAASSAENSGIYVGSLDSKPEEQSSKVVVATPLGPGFVPSPDSDAGHLLFRREGTLLAQPFNERTLELTGEPVPIAEELDSYFSYGTFSASGNGVLVYQSTGRGTGFQLAWLDGQGKVAQRVGTPDMYTGLALSPDGTHAAFRRNASGSRDLWVMDLVRSVSQRFTFGQGSADNPVWSPDGKRIVYRSLFAGGGDIYWKQADGATSEEVLFKSAETKTPTSWSRDGRYLLFTVASAKTRSDVWVLPLAGDRKALPLLQTEFDESDAQFSPDGRWIAYVSTESGSPQIYVRGFSPDTNTPVTAQGKWMVSRSTALYPRWLSNGKGLRYLNGDAHVMGVDVTTRDGAFEAGSPQDLYKVPLGVQQGAFAGDGRLLVAVPMEQTAPTPLTVVLNWQAGLKK